MLLFVCMGKMVHSWGQTLFTRPLANVYCHKFSSIGKRTCIDFAWSRYHIRAHITTSELHLCLASGAEIGGISAYMLWVDNLLAIALLHQRMDPAVDDLAFRWPQSWSWVTVWLWSLTHYCEAFFFWHTLLIATAAIPLLVIIEVTNGCGSFWRSLFLFWARLNNKSLLKMRWLHLIMIHSIFKR